MSTSHAASRDARQDRSDKRRKRKERAARARTPEPKDIVSGAGQPLDLSVRRELEERLGHDFSQVRLHTDRDAGALTELLGADAVAVGRDIFFREGTYRPGTADGQRLLAHELLHTVQNPHGLGALRAGRDLGAVSLPQQAVEQEAESAAQEAARDGAVPDGGPQERTPGAEELGEGHATPGWLRYAMVDADRNRMEKLDPATLVDRLANGVLRSLRGDPADRSRRARMQLAAFSDELQERVLDRLEVRLPSSEYDRLLDLVSEAESEPPAPQPATAPEPVPDTVEQAEDERADRRREATGERAGAERRDRDAHEERQDLGRARGEQERLQREKRARDAAAERKSAQEARDRDDERAGERRRTEAGDRRARERQARQDDDREQTERDTGQRQHDEAERTGDARKEQREREEADPEQANEPGADKRRRKDEEHAPAEGSRREEIDPKAKGQPGPVRPEKVDERAEQRDSALSEHGLHEEDEAEGDPREEEQPIGLEAGADRDIGGDGTGGDAAGGGPGAPELKPEDYLPDTDLDVSSVPTADQLLAAGPGAAPQHVPTFPAPPPTKAERVQEERENAAAEEEREDEPEAEAKAPGAEQGPVEGEAPQPEGGPAADAGDRGERDLQPEKPVDQEVGPDPEAQGQQHRPEPEPEAADDPERQQERTADAAEAADRGEQDGAGGEDAAGGGEERPDAKEAQDAQQERRDREERQEGPDAAAAAGASVRSGGAAGAAGSAATAAAPSMSATPPAGAHTEPTPAEDRHPSPAVRRAAGPAKGEHEAPAPKSRIPKESGPGAAPSGVVGGSEPHGPTTSAGPGGAPSTAQAAVSPAAEQADAPGKFGAPAPEGAKARPEASLEKDGGGCAPPAPAPEQDGGEKGGCGAGGGGAAPKEEKRKEPPDVSGQDPKTALATVSQLPPDQAQAALPGVDASAARKTGEERKRLAAHPPTRERPSGAPTTRSEPPKAAPPAAQVRERVERAEPENREKQPRAKAEDKAQGRNPAADVRRPQVQDGADGKISADGARNVQAAADSVPTTDLQLYKTVGPAPKIQLTGESDPKRTDTQAENLKKTQRTIQTTGREDASKPMGEDQIYPNAPREQLRGKVPGGSGGGGAGARGGAVPDQGVAAVTQQERGGQIRGAAGRARGRMAAKEKEQQQGEQQAKRQKQTEIDNEVTRNAERQTGERGRAAEGARRERESWRAEQDRHIEDADKKSEQEHTGKNKEIEKRRAEKDKDVQDRRDHDNKEIDKEREKAEKEARKKKDEKKEDSGGFFGWVKDKVNQFIDGLVKAITWVFDQARKAINGLIEGFKTFVDKAIDLARDLAVGLINKLADALIALGDVLLAAFPALRDKFRKAVEGLRDRAIAAVNRLADGLKKAVNALLDALAAGLNKLLDVLEAGLKFAVELYRKALLAAINFAEKAIAALGKFAALIADIAPDPGGWLSKAGSSARTGITDHLWGAIKTGVKRWFDSKVEGVLGLGKVVIDVLVKGCVSLKQIGKMAWDAIIASLPMMIASIVIEKVVSMVVPAAGAILTIVQGLMAAWQSLSSILTAFGKFWAYLKAVKAGPAACLFAEAVAAGLVALLDFITNFLMMRLSRATKGVGKRLKAMAQKIMKGLKKAGRGARKAAGSAVNRARGAARKAAQALRRPGRAAKPKGPRVPGRRATSADRGPGAHRTGPKDTAHDRPSSRTPDRERDHRREEDAAKRDREAEQPGRTPEAEKPQTSKDKTPEKAGEKTGEKAGDRSKEKPGEKPGKKKETEAPKRAKPRKPKSPLGRALGRVRGAVKSALRKVRNAGRALGRKLSKSKVGRALKRSGKNLRDWFKRKRDDWRTKHRQHRDRTKQDRDKRKKKEHDKESKQARLRKIVARIRPRLERILRRGTTGLALNATLLAMRTWYRLTSLRTVGTPTFDIRAVLNPEALAGGGFRLTASEIRTLVHEVSQELLNRPDIQQRALRMRRSKSGLLNRFRTGHPVEVADGPDIPAAVRYLRERGTNLEISMPGGRTLTVPPYKPPLWKDESYLLGREREKVLELNSPGFLNAFTRGVFAYPEIAARMGKSGLTDRQIANYIRTYINTGKLPKGLSRRNRRLLRNATWLMFVRESVRNPANVGFSAMTMDLLRRGPERGGMSWHEALAEYENTQTTGRRGRFPMSMAKAMRAVRGVEAVERGQAPGTTSQGGTRAEREELVRRETELAEQWAAAVTNNQGILGDTEEDAMKEGRDKVRSALEKFYAMQQGN